MRPLGQHFSAMVVVVVVVIRIGVSLILLIPMYFVACFVFWSTVRSRGQVGL